jgi:hypothetical protein
MMGTGMVPETLVVSNGLMIGTGMVPEMVVCNKLMIGTEIVAETVVSNEHDGSIWSLRPCHGSGR